MSIRTLAAALAACGESPTGGTTPVAPRFDGGMTFGGGTAVQDGEEETCPEGRGGMMFGGGTYTGGPPSCPEPEPAP